jgi:glycosyltransferase involved in cell wall biosynthesis
MYNYLVSVITASYNSESFILRTIRSVQAQTMQDWEMLITDDCSKDTTVDILKEQAALDPRIKYFVLEKNSGAGVARNTSIEHASGRYIAFLDGDDMWSPLKLEKQISFMKTNNCAMSYTSHLTCDELDNVNGIVVCPKKHSLSDSKRDNKLGFSTVMYDTEKVGKIFMPSIRKRQDWGLNMSVLKKCGIAYGLVEPLTFYRRGQESLSKNKMTLAKYHIAVYQEVLGWSKIRAMLWQLFVYMPCWTWKKIVIRLYNR